MPRTSPARLRIWGALLLSFSLVSCSSSPAALPTLEASGDLPLIHSQVPLPTASAPGQSSPGSPDSSSASTPSPLTSSPTLIDKQPVESASTVEASTIHTKPTDQAKTPKEHAFEPKSPSLAGIALGATDKIVVKHFGLPPESYPLPGDKQTIEIWQYDGFSIGLNDKDKVVYVEITSSQVKSGIQGLLIGMKSSEAADKLGIESNEQSNVLTVEVSGGWIKVDLDPDTQKVLSLKLISKEI